MSQTKTALTPAEKAAIARLVNQLEALGTAAGQISRVYDEEAANNIHIAELVSIADLFVESIDEWVFSIASKIEELKRKIQSQRVRLVYTSDPYTKIKSGTLGTVDFTDDIGTVHITWDDGHKLGLVPGEDQWETI